VGVVHLEVKRIGRPPIQIIVREGPLFTPTVERNLSFFALPHARFGSVNAKMAQIPTQSKEWTGV
jgi:hypothetical protein